MFGGKWNRYRPHAAVGTRQDHRVRSVHCGSADDDTDHQTPVAAAPYAGADLAAVWCVDYAHRSAVRMGAAGVDGFGCLAVAQAPPGIGIRLSY